MCAPHMEWDGHLWDALSLTPVKHSAQITIPIWASIACLKQQLLLRNKQANFRLKPNETVLKDDMFANNHVFRSEWWVFCFVYFCCVYRPSGVCSEKAMVIPTVSGRLCSASGTKVTEHSLWKSWPNNEEHHGTYREARAQEKKSLCFLSFIVCAYSGEENWDTVATSQPSPLGAGLLQLKAWFFLWPQANPYTPVGILFLGEWPSYLLSRSLWGWKLEKPSGCSRNIYKHTNIGVSAYDCSLQRPPTDIS